MRIHMVVALYVLVFSLFFDLSAAEYGVLFVLIGLVLSLECLNTALEAAGNAISREKNPHVKILKDTAAAAVLIFAMAAVAVGIVIFWKPAGFSNLYGFFSAQPWWLLLLAAVSVVCLLFICCGPTGFAAFFKGKKQKK